jgi:hypothetical protein
VDADGRVQPQWLSRMACSLSVWRVDADGRVQPQWLSRMACSFL